MNYSDDKSELREKIAGITYAKHCDCGDVGFHVVANKYTGDPEQQQCEFCYTQNSYFNLDKIISLCTEHSKQSEWVRVEDRLPEYEARAGSDEFVHVFASFNGFTSQAMYCNSKWDVMGIHGITPTHWQPLPSPPVIKVI